MIIYDFEQQLDEWFEIRKGKVTASHAQAIANCGDGLETYLIGLMAEYFSTGEKKRFSNEHTDRGNELEPVARELYEVKTGNKVEQVGFIEYNHYSGASPDGLVLTDGGIEIKCIDDIGYFKLLLNGEKEIDTKYIWQIQMCLLVTGRKWWDFVAYNPNYLEIGKEIFICRIYPDQEKFKKLNIGIALAEVKIREIINKITF